MSDTIIPAPISENSAETKREQLSVYSKSQVDSIVAQSTAPFNDDLSTIVYKVGKVCFITCFSGAWINDGTWTAIRNKDFTVDGAHPQWIIPSGFRPIKNCEILDTFGQKRIVIMPNGEVQCNTHLTEGTTLRFSACYICA